MENGGVAARRAGVGTPYRVSADSPDGLLRLSAAARNAGDGVPYRVCADLPKAEASHCRVLRGRRDAAPYKAAAGSSLSFPLWGKVAFAVRRMTEEGLPPLGHRR